MSEWSKEDWYSEVIALRKELTALEVLLGVDRLAQKQATGLLNEPYQTETRLRLKGRYADV